MGMNYKTVDLALSINDFDLARVYANKAADQKAKKTLWLKITKRLVDLNSQKKQSLAYDYD